MKETLGSIIHEIKAVSTQRLSVTTTSLGLLELSKPSITLVSGPPGVGKTRLCYEVAKQACMDNFRVLWISSKTMPEFGQWLKGKDCIFYCQYYEPAQLIALLKTRAQIYASLVIIDEISEINPKLSTLLTATLPKAVILITSPMSSNGGVLQSVLGQGKWTSQAQNIILYHEH